MSDPLIYLATEVLANDAEVTDTYKADYREETVKREILNSLDSGLLEELEWELELDREEEAIEDAYYERYFTDADYADMADRELGLR